MTYQRHGYGHVVLGLLLVAFGLLAFLDRMGLMEMDGVIRTYWPLILVFWGLDRAVFDRRGGRWLGIAAVLVGGLLLGNRLLGWHFRLGDLWPLLVVFVGLRMAFGPRRRRRLTVTAEGSCGGRRGEPFGAPGAPPAPPPPPFAARAAGETPPDPAQDDPAAWLNETAFLGGIERRYSSQSFRGGTVTALLGGVEIDLRECRLGPDEARLTMLAVMGGVSLKVPRDWVVVTDIAAILGGVDNRADAPVGQSGGRLVISGTAVMGGIEITH